MGHFPGEDRFPVGFEGRGALVGVRDGALRCDDRRQDKPLREGCPNGGFPLESSQKRGRTGPPCRR
eukprot:1662933-Pyramimonas_sp.AAC.1